MLEISKNKGGSPMKKGRKKSLIAYANHEWEYNFKWIEHPAGGFNKLTFPETWERKVGFADTKLEITIKELI
jgi:hypothetical protein